MMEQNVGNPVQIAIVPWPGSRPRGRRGCSCFCCAGAPAAVAGLGTGWRGGGHRVKGTVTHFPRTPPRPRRRHVGYQVLKAFLWKAEKPHALQEKR